MIREATDEEFLELTLGIPYTSFRYASFIKSYNCEVGIFVAPHPDGILEVCGEPMFVFMLCYGIYDLEYLPYLVMNKDFHSISPNIIRRLEKSRISKPVFDDQDLITHWE